MIKPAPRGKAPDGGKGTLLGQIIIWTYGLLPEAIFLAFIFRDLHLQYNYQDWDLLKLGLVFLPVGVITGVMYVYLWNPSSPENETPDTGCLKIMTALLLGFLTGLFKGLLFLSSGVFQQTPELFLNFDWVRWSAYLGLADMLVAIISVWIVHKAPGEAKLAVKILAKLGVR